MKKRKPRKPRTWKFNGWAIIGIEAKWRHGLLVVQDSVHASQFLCEGRTTIGPVSVTITERLPKKRRKK